MSEDKLVGDVYTLRLRGTIRGMTFEEVIDWVEASASDRDYQEYQGEGMHIVVRCENLFVVYDDEGPRWAIGSGRVLGRDD